MKEKILSRLNGEYTIAVRDKKGIRFVRKNGEMIVTRGIMGNKPVVLGMVSEGVYKPVQEAFINGRKIDVMDIKEDGGELLIRIAE